MGLFSKKTKEKKEEAVAAAPASEKKGPSIHNVKVPTAKAEPVKVAPAKAPAAKATPAKATVAKAPAAKATTVKAAPAKASAAKATAPKAATKPNTTAPKTVKANGVDVPLIPRPFFVKTEEDVRIAFDQAIAAAEEQILRNGAKAVGKYEFELEVDGYHFYLIANNGQILFDSPGFTTLIGALNGIETFKKTVAEGTFDIRVDKYNRYRFILERKYFGENYTTKDQCQKCAESVKNFANNAKIIRYIPSKEAVKEYEAAKESKRRPDDIDWKAVEAAEKKAPKMGKFEICNEQGQYTFYLTANNGQILYSSRYYANEAAARRGVESFKRAAYVGNFFVDRDKFGNFRYVLKNIGSAPSFIGESYDNKPQCEKIIESVKKFIVSATIELEEA